MGDEEEANFLPPSPPTATTRERTNVGVMERKEATTAKINHLIPPNEASSSSSATISKQGYTCSFPCDTKASLHWRRKSKEKRGRRRGVCIAHWQ